MGVEINKSRITARITHDKVKLDLLARGWIPIDAAEEQPFDIILDVGIHDDARLFQTIQVKTWTSLKTSSRVFNSFCSENCGEMILVSGRGSRKTIASPPLGAVT